jgi:hypothetical protein
MNILQRQQLVLNFRWFILSDSEHIGNKTEIGYTRKNLIYGNTVYNYLLWLFTVCVSLKNISLIWKRHHCIRRAATFKAMLRAEGLWAGRDLYRSTTAVIRGIRFCGLIRGLILFSSLLQHTKIDVYNLFYPLRHAGGWSILCDFRRIKISL